MNICPACEAKRRHRPEDLAHHPLMGHGFAYAQGWCCEAAQLAHQRELDEQAAAIATLLTTRPTSD